MGNHTTKEKVSAQLAPASHAVQCEECSKLHRFFRVPLALLSWLRKPAVMLVGWSYFQYGCYTSCAYSRFYRIIMTTAHRLRNRISAAILWVSSMAAPYCGLATIALGLVLRPENVHKALLPIVVDAAVFYGVLGFGLVEEE